jgi:glutamate 5-kinase
MPPQLAGATKISEVAYGQDLSHVETGGTSTGVGTGGAVTKVAAAKLATDGGVDVILTSVDQVSAALEGQSIGTWFRARS